MDLKTELARAARSIAEGVRAEGVFGQVVERERKGRRRSIVSRSIIIGVALVLGASGVYGLLQGISPSLVQGRGPAQRPLSGGFPTVSGQIALVRSEPNLGPSIESEIYIMDFTDGGTALPEPNLVRQAPSGESDDQPSWSPDGSQIAFVTGTPTGLGGSAGNGDIFIMNSDGTDARQLSSGGNSAYPTWSPDGSQIAFVMDQGTALMVANVADGNDVEAITAGTHLGAPSWGTSGTILFSMASEGNGQIYRINPDGSELVQLSSGFDDGSPAWSPDGTSIVFSRSDPRDSTGTGQLFTMNADGTNVRQLTECDAPECVGDGAPSWSPDGTLVAFTRQANGGNSVDACVIRADGTGLASLTNGPDWWSSPDWRP